MPPRSRLSFVRFVCRTGSGTLALVALCALSACGGGGASSEAQSPEPSAAPVTEVEASSDEVPEAAVAAAPAPRCDDGTCFECGEGLCPQGFYCDGDAAGGPACSWVPDCAKKPTCACLLRTLGKGCRCDDSGPGPTVTCG